MSIVPSFPYTLTNGTEADANQVMANLNTIQSSVNTYAAPSASPTFSGTMTMPDGSTWNSAALAYAGAKDLAATGYITLPSGFIQQWGSGTFSSGVCAVDFSISFPNACLGISAIHSEAGAAGNYATIVAGVPTTAGVTFFASSVDNTPFMWFAFGW